MKISNLQINEKRENYIDDLLKKSIIPTSLIVSKYVNNELKNENLGIPQFKPFDIGKFEVSNKKKWNKNFKNLGVDLALLYKSFNLLNNDVLACEELYLSEKEKLDNKLDVLNIEIDNIRRNLKSTNDLYSYVQIFNNFYTCELDGDSERNIPTTTSFVDLVQRNVRNEKISSVEAKVNILNSKISIDSNNISPSNEIGKLENILNDISNDFYFVEYNTLTKDNLFEIKLKLALPYAKKMSSVLLECSSPSEYKASLKISKDNNIYNNIYTVKGNNIIEWMFDEQEVSSIEITLTKESVDGTKNRDIYYYYIFKCLSCLNEEYDTSSTYVSNKIEIPSIVDNFTINSNEIVLQGTSIDYFVGLDNGKDPIEWKQFFNNKEDSMKLFRYRSKILNNALKEYGEYIDDGCYKIYNLPKGYTNNDLTLYYGYQMWHLQTLNPPETEDPEKYIPDIIDYTDYYLLRSSLVDTEEYEFSIRNAKTHLFTQYVYCDKEYYVRDKGFTCKTTTGIGLRSKMYLNNAELTCIDNKYNFTLKKGLNTIHVLLYIQSSNSEGFSDIKHNLNFKEYSFDIFAGKPMKFMNSNSLRFDGIQDNHIYYSIENDSIIVKDDMHMINENITFPNLRSDLNYKNNSRYLIKFNQIDINNEYLVDIKNNKTCVRVMANLRSNNKSYSPQINNFSLIAR